MTEDNVISIDEATPTPANLAGAIDKLNADLGVTGPDWDALNS